MRRLAALATVAGLAGAGFLTAAPAQAFCPVQNIPVVPCYSAVGDCITVRVYTGPTGSPSNQVCLD